METRRGSAKGSSVGARFGPLQATAKEPYEPELHEVWPEGAKARSALEEWCEAEGVPGPSAPPEGHRPRRADLQPGFGLVNKPVAANSAEWKSQAGQQALDDEQVKHEKRVTWELDKVVELSQLLQEMRQSGEEVVIGELST